MPHDTALAASPAPAPPALSAANRGRIADAASTAGRFLVGDAVSVADVFLVPQLYNARRFGLNIEPYPLLTRVDAACGELPAFHAAHADRQPDREDG